MMVVYEGGAGTHLDCGGSMVSRIVMTPKEQQRRVRMLCRKIKAILIRHARSGTRVPRVLDPVGLVFNIQRPVMLNDSTLST